MKLKIFVILSLILAISLWLNIVQYSDKNKLKSDLESCLEVKISCETNYGKEIKKYNDSQIRASETIKKLQEATIEKSFEDCLNMPIPDSFLQLYRGKDNSN